MAQEPAGTGYRVTHKRAGTGGPVPGEAVAAQERSEAVCSRDVARHGARHVPPCRLVTAPTRPMRRPPRVRCRAAPAPLRVHRAPAVAPRVSASSPRRRRGRHAGPRGWWRVGAGRVTDWGGTGRVGAGRGRC